MKVVLLFFLAATLSAAMPGRHSVEKLAARRQRACDRGYLVPRADGIAHIAVPGPVVERVKAVTRSLVLHRDHVLLAREPLPVARVAARAVKGFSHRRSSKLHC